jgi:hypothetical protein
MDDNAGLQQAGLINPLIDEILVIIFFEGTPFTASIRADFNSSL